MIVKESDSTRRKLFWWFVTLLAELAIIAVFWGIPITIIWHDFVWAGIVLFLVGTLIGRKLCCRVENRIGLFCSLQNPNRNNLVRIEIPYPPWGRVAKAPPGKAVKKHRK